MNRVLSEWNRLEPDAASEQILPCCESRRWAVELAKSRPYHDPEELCRGSDRIWRALNEADWQEAFDSHPRIGERLAQGHAGAKAQAWSQQEQRTSEVSAESPAPELADGNAAYEAKFGRIFIVCAMGKTTQEILDLLHSRLGNDATTELSQAVEEQGKITQLRLRRWLEEAAP